MNKPANAGFDFLYFSDHQLYPSVIFRAFANRFGIAIAFVGHTAGVYFLAYQKLVNGKRPVFRQFTLSGVLIYSFSLKGRSTAYMPLYFKLKIFKAMQRQGYFIKFFP